MLNGKVIVVTGGAGLIGQRFVEAILAHNGIAVIADRDKSSAQILIEKLSGKYKYTPFFIEIDITNEISVKNAIETLNKKYGKIDALVNNAYPRNKNYGKHFFDVKYDDFCENMDMNVGGYFLCSQKFSEYFIIQGKGNIINIGSIYGIIAPKFEVYDNTPMTMVVEYAAIKSAILHLTKYMAKYFKGKNIRVNALCPGGIFDDQPKAFVEQYKALCLNKGMLDPEDMIGSLCFLLSDDSQYMNGQILTVDDGFTL